MKAHTNLVSRHGQASIHCVNAQLVHIQADQHAATYHAQGFATAQMRLWQLDLSRRVAAGRLSEVMGAATFKADRFQRNLGLSHLAERSVQEAQAHPERIYLEAYVEGINQALSEMRVLPLEFYALGCRPQPFDLKDVYLVAHLKYFINSAWQFELFHTLACLSLQNQQSAALFSSFDEAGRANAPLPEDIRYGFAQDFADLLRDAQSALDLLGLDSPDIGSNAFAVRGEKTQSGFPLLANDPHMGLVNPGFNLFFHLQSQQGLNVMGSNFPGAPGIVVGRNADIAWGMTGVMMDNQDLFYGSVDLERGQVKTHAGWQALQCTEEDIVVRRGQCTPHRSYRFAGGHMLMAHGGMGLFLRWPALEEDLGSVSLHRLNTATNWAGFREGLAELKNSPGIAVYADSHNNIGAQIYGLLPLRLAENASAGAYLLPLADARWQWQGYANVPDLPHEFNPPEQQVVHANQYAELFARTYISNRWHSPARAMRIKHLLSQKSQLTANDMAAIQDDQIDGFSQRWAPVLLQYLPLELREKSILLGWGGDTRKIACTVLFEAWFDRLAFVLLTQNLPEHLANGYLNYWPAYRWNIVHILMHKRDEWGLDSFDTVIHQAYVHALGQVGKVPQVEFRHSLRRYPLVSWLFKLCHPYTGGSRETVSALRRNIDFLTKGQSGDSTENFSFGTSFKMVFDLQPGASNLYLANMPNSGNPVGIWLRKHLRRWRFAQRFTMRF